MTGEGDQNIIEFMSNEKEDIDITRSSLMPSSTFVNDVNKTSLQTSVRKTTVVAGPVANKCNELEKIAYYDRTKDNRMREQYLKTDLNKKVVIIGNEANGVSKEVSEEQP